MFLKKCYHLLPIQFRNEFSSFLGNFLDRLKKAFNPFYQQVFVYEGLEQTSLLPVTFAYLGSPGQTQEYLAQKILASGYLKQDLGRCVWFLFIPFLKKNCPGCHFMYVECNSLTLGYFSDKPKFSIPRWVEMELILTPPESKLLGSERSEIVRKIKKNNLTYEMSQDSKDIELFYSRMYFPYIQSRYQNTALISSQPKIQKIFSSGELILIKKDGISIAGGLIEYLKDQKVNFRMLGVKDGNHEFVQLGAIGALYYYLTFEMKKRGYQKINIGATRPFLTDGVTKFKKSIKGQLVINKKPACIQLILLKDSQGAKNFFINNPFIYYNHKRKIYLEGIGVN